MFNNVKSHKNTSQISHDRLTAAGLAGGVTFVTGLRLDVLVEAWRAALQALSPLPHVDVVLSTAQTVSVTATPAVSTRGVTLLANHGGGVAKVTEKEGGGLVCDVR